MRFLRPAIVVPLVLAAATPLAAQLLLRTFQDVPEGSTYYDAVENLAAKGIIEGYEDATFKPFNGINRAEFTKIVVGSVAGKGELDGCLVNAKAAGRDPLFLDAREYEWFAKFVCVAKTRGIVGGYPDGTFRPAAEINFAEAAKIVVKAVRPPTSQSVAYDAQDAIWYRPFVIALEEWSAIPVTVESLTHVMTRGEMAEMLYRLQEKRGKPSRTYDDFTSFWTSFINELYGVKVPYPKVSPVPVFAQDGAPTGESLAYPGRSLWRLSLGARITCPPGAGERCAEYEWIADGFSREAADDAVDELFTNPGVITVQGDAREADKRVIIYTERSGCLHKEALVLGPEYAVRLHWFCGGDNKDFTNNYLFEYIAGHIEFFNTAASRSSRPASSRSSVSASSSARSSGASAPEMASSASSPADEQPSSASSSEEPPPILGLSSSAVSSQESSPVIIQAGSARSSTSSRAFMMSSRSRLPSSASKSSVR